MANEENKLVDSEKSENNNWHSIISEFIAIRNECGLSQRDLAELSGIKQPAIARMESLGSVPQLNTIQELLQTMGATLKIVKIEQRLTTDEQPFELENE